MILTRRWLLATLASLSLLASHQPAVADDRPDLVVAVPKLARGLEPSGNDGNVDVRVTHSIFDTLIRRDFVAQAETGKATFVPGLAESWTRTAPNEIVLKLRQGVKWHDGTEFTAEDVAFSFGEERVFGDGAPLRKIASTLGKLERIEVLGPYEVKMIWAAPDYLIEDRLANKGSWIVQAAAYRKHKTDGAPLKEWMAAAVDAVTWAPVGTGPYKFDSFKAGEELRLVANDAYFMGAPAAASITFVEVPEVATRIAGLVSGEFDIVVDLPPDQLPVLERYDTIQIKPVERENTHVLVFNTAHPQLADRRIREAISLGIDRTELVETIWRGTTTTPQGPQLRAFNDMYLDDLPGFAFDPDRARALLAEAGYDGSAITLRFIPGYYTLGVEAAQVLQQMWRDVGLNVELMPVENWDAVRDDQTMIYTWSNTYRFLDPLGQLAVSYGPNSAIQKKYKYWKNPRFDELVTVLETTTDIETRRTAFRELAGIYMTEIPSTFLYNPADIYAIRAGIDYTPTPQFFEDFRPDNLRVTAGQ